MTACIRDIAGHLPALVLTNEALEREFPTWNLALAAQRMGVRSRHVAAADETALDLAEQACLKLFEQNEGLKERLDAIVFCTQSADYIMPSNSCLLHGKLQLADNVSIWDLNHACSGYIYALGQAYSLIQSGMASNVLVVTADTYSKFINPRDRSARILFGDGAAATWVANQAANLESMARIQAPVFGTAGTLYDKFMIPAGGCRLAKSTETQIEHPDESGNFRSQENIHMAGQDILNFVTSKIPNHVQETLAKHQLTTNDMDLFIFHQASGIVLDVLTRLLRLPEERVFRNLEQIGNTVSSSIPLALRAALDSGRAKPGNKVLLCGFGVGLSWGSMVVDL